MNTIYRSLAVAALHCLFVLSVAGKYELDRQRLPRAWAKAVRFDPTLPVRGRYVSLHLIVDAEPGTSSSPHAGLKAENGRLVAIGQSNDSGVHFFYTSNQQDWTLAEPVVFFLPEHVADPTIHHTGEELWVEVSVPRRGPPRPIRLAVKSHGVLRHVEMN